MRVTARNRGRWGNRRTFAVASVGVICLTAAACGSSSSGGDASASGSHLTTVKAAVYPEFDLLPIAKAEGFDKQNGIDLQLKPVTQGATFLLQLQIRNQVQATSNNGINTVLESEAKGAPVVGVASGIINTPAHPGNRMDVLSDSGINSAQDLIGKKVGDIGPGTAVDFALNAYLLKNGVDPSKVKHVTIAAPELGPALLNHQVDAIYSFLPFISALEKTAGSKVRTLTNDFDVLPTSHLLGIYTFTRSYVAQHPATVRDFVAMIRQAAAFVQSDPSKARADVAQLTNQKLGDVTVQDYPSNACIDMSALQQWVTALQQQKLLSSSASAPSGGWATNQYNDKCS